MIGWLRARLRATITGCTCDERYTPVARDAGCRVHGLVAILTHCNDDKRKD